MVLTVLMMVYYYFTIFRTRPPLEVYTLYFFIYLIGLHSKIGFPRPAGRRRRHCHRPGGAAGRPSVPFLFLSLPFLSLPFPLPFLSFPFFYSIKTIITHRGLPAL